RLHNPAFAWHLIISLADPRRPVLQPFGVAKDPSDFGISDRDARQGSELAYPGPEVRPLALVAHGPRSALRRLTATVHPAIAPAPTPPSGRPPGRGPPAGRPRPPPPTRGGGPPTSPSRAGPPPTRNNHGTHREDARPKVVDGATLGDSDAHRDRAPPRRSDRRG